MIGRNVVHKWEKIKGDYMLEMLGVNAASQKANVLEGKPTLLYSEDIAKQISWSNQVTHLVCDNIFYGIK